MYDMLAMTGGVFILPLVIIGAVLIGIGAIISKFGKK